MIWIFSSVVLILMVINPGFLRVMLWLGGVGCVLMILSIIGMALSDYSRSAPKTLAKTSCEKSTGPITAFFECGVDSKE